MSQQDSNRSILEENTEKPNLYGFGQASDVLRHNHIESGGVNIAEDSISKTYKGKATQANSDKKYSSQMLFLQLQRIEEGIKNLDDLMDKYGTKLKDLEDLAIGLADRVATHQDTLAIMRDYDGHDGLNRLYREHYGTFPVLESADNSFWAALEDNILRDDQGNMVYMDETGAFYKLSYDENGELITQANPDDPTEQIPVRDYYDNEIITAELYSRVYNKENPALVANKTPFGEDTQNNYLQDQNNFGHDLSGLSKNPQTAPENIIASVTKEGDTFQACTYFAGAIEVCTQVSEDLEEQVKLHKENLAEHEIELAELKAQQEYLKQNNNGTQQERDALEQEIKALEKQIEQEMEAIESLQEKIADPDQSFAAAKGLSGVFSTEAAPPPALTPTPDSVIQARYEEEIEAHIHNATINGKTLDDILADATPEMRATIMENLPEGIIIDDTRLNTPTIFDPESPGHFKKVREPNLDNIPHKEHVEITGAKFKEDPDKPTSKLSFDESKGELFNGQKAQDLAIDSNSPALKIQQQLGAVI